jgi:hypothetical protein
VIVWHFANGIGHVRQHSADRDKDQGSSGGDNADLLKVAGRFNIAGPVRELTAIDMDPR